MYVCLSISEYIYIYTYTKPHMACPIFTEDLRFTSLNT